MSWRENRDLLVCCYIALGVVCVAVAGVVFLLFLARYEASQVIIYK